MLSGKRCLITGASRGIGEAIALTYAKEGATLLLSSRGKDDLQQAADKCKNAGAPVCDIFCADLAEPNQVQGLAEHALQTFGTIDVLVNNAGFFPGSAGTCLNGDTDIWTKMMQVNVLTPMTLMRLLAPKMVEQEDGVIINIGSQSGIEPMTTQGAYAAAKWALRGWTLSVYSELRNHNIKVCLINPGMIRTDFIPERNAKANLDRMMEPEDVAEATMLPFRTTSKCVPCEINLKLTRFAF